MIKDNDTLLYKEEMQIQNGDTSYIGACWTFEKVNGEIINQSDDKCLCQGKWVITDSIGNYSTGSYEDSKKVGVWKTYSRDGSLIKLIEYAYLADEVYTIKEIDYSKGEAKVIVDRAFLGFYINYFKWIVIIIFGSFFIRFFINNEIYNIENKTNFTAILLLIPGSEPNNMMQNFKCMFTLWFFNYKPQNRKKVIISNLLTLISLGTFIGILIGLGLAGELH